MDETTGLTRQRVTRWTKTTAEAKAKDDDELQARWASCDEEDLRCVEIVAKLQMQWDKRRQNCRLLKNLRAERLPMETQMAADVFRRCAKDLQKLYVQEYGLLRRWRREDVRRYAPSAVKRSCARLAGKLLRKFRRWQIVAQAAVSQRRRRKRKRNCRRIVAAAAGCSAGRWRREMSGQEKPVACAPQIGYTVA